MMSGLESPADDVDLYARRLAIYEQELGAPEHTIPDASKYRIDIHAFGRDFAPDCEDGSDEGYVLVTNGMSNARMNVPPSVRPDHAKRRAELMWYVREPTPEICGNLRWLAAFPFIDDTWLGSGHRVPLPGPAVAGSDFRTFLFLTPIIRSDQRLADALAIADDAVEILTVNLISDREYELIKRDGLGALLNLLDENAYPLVFDPSRRSYV
jgi:Suppressor of fused protein (SUFU)